MLIDPELGFENEGYRQIKTSHKAGDRRTDYRDAFSSNLDALQATVDFCSATGYEQQLAAIQEVSRVRTIDGLATTGLMHVEAAFSAPSSDLVLEHIEQAKHDIITAKRLDLGLSNTTRTRAALTLASMDLYQALALTGNIPSPKFHERAYDGTLGIAEIFLDKCRKRTLTFEDIGSASEISVLLLLQRFAINEGIEEWMAVPSVYSQDNEHGWKELKNTWDISVLTQYDRTEAPNITYKIQVKSSPEASYKKAPYGNEVVEIIANRDLRSPNNTREKGLPVYTVLEEALSEAGRVTPWYQREGDYLKELLDRRQGWLLDALDNNKVN